MNKHFKRLPPKAQTITEYLLLLTITASITLIALMPGKKGLLTRSYEASHNFFNTIGNGIMGAEIKQVTLGICGDHECRSPENPCTCSADCKTGPLCPTSKPHCVNRQCVQCDGPNPATGNHPHCDDNNTCNDPDLCVSHVCQHKTPTSNCCLKDCPVGFDCGEYPDNCGNMLNCGDCNNSLRPHCLASFHQCVECLTDSHCSTPGALHCDSASSTPSYSCVECTVNSHCTSPATCGGGGTPNVCGIGCIPTVTQCPLEFQCGDISNGCPGGVLHCGRCDLNPATPYCLLEASGSRCVQCTDPSHCTPPQTCGGGGTPNVCGSPGGCSPETDQQFCLRIELRDGKDYCGSITGPNNCGTTATVDCGGCPNGYDCGIGGAPNICAPKRYACNENTGCQEVGNGAFTLTECEAACKPLCFQCNSGDFRKLCLTRGDCSSVGGNVRSLCSGCTDGRVCCGLGRCEDSCRLLGKVDCDGPDPGCEATVDGCYCRACVGEELQFCPTPSGCLDGERQCRNGTFPPCTDTRRCFHSSGCGEQTCTSGNWTVCTRRQGCCENQNCESSYGENNTNCPTDCPGGCTNGQTQTCTTSSGCTSGQQTCSNNSWGICNLPSSTCTPGATQSCGTTRNPGVKTCNECGSWGLCVYNP